MMLFLVFLVSVACLSGQSLGQQYNNVSATYNTSLYSDVWPESLSNYPPLATRYNWNIIPKERIKSVANLTLENQEIEFENEFAAEETTPKSAKQLNTGVLLRNNNLNPALNALGINYNPYNTLSSSLDPLSTNFNPLNTATFDTVVPRADDGLDAFTARRASTFDLGVGTKIRFQDTVTQVSRCSAFQAINSECM